MIRIALIHSIILLLIISTAYTQQDPENRYSPDSTFRQNTGGITLLKNHGSLLPLSMEEISSIALIGPAIKSPGLACVIGPDYHQKNYVSPFQGLKDMLGDSISLYTATGINMQNDVVRLDSSIVYVGQGVNGFSAKYYNGKKASGSPVKFETDKFIDFHWTNPPYQELDSVFSVSWDATLIPKHGPVKVKLIHSDGARLSLNGELLIDNWHSGPVRVDSAWINIQKGESYNIQIDYFSDGGPAVVKFGFDYLESNLLFQAVEQARRADVAVVVLCQTASFHPDGSISASYDVPRQSRLIRQVYEANPNTILLLQTAAPVDIEAWAFDIPVIIQAGMPYDEAGKDIARVFFGRDNPSARLPYHWTMNKNQNYATRFPYGHGLSYTTFGIGKLLMRRDRDNTGWTATVEIRNMNDRAGTEVLQVYISKLEDGEKNELPGIRAFKKVSLMSEQKKIVAINIPYEAFEYFNEEEKTFAIDPGMYEIAVGTSSEDIKLRKTIEIKAQHINK